MNEIYFFVVILKLNHYRVSRLLEEHKKIKIEKLQHQAIITLRINYSGYYMPYKCNISNINQA